MTRGVSPMPHAQEPRVQRLNVLRTRHDDSRPAARAAQNAEARD
jgi:hypothetical protein